MAYNLGVAVSFLIKAYMVIVHMMLRLLLEECTDFTINATIIHTCIYLFLSCTALKKPPIYQETLL